jgi:hypothetical protein
VKQCLLGQGSYKLQHRVERGAGPRTTRYPHIAAAAAWYCILVCVLLHMLLLLGAGFTFFNTRTSSW